MVVTEIMRLSINKLFSGARLLAQWRIFKIALLLLVIGGVFYMTQSSLTSARNNISTGGSSTLDSFPSASSIMDIFLKSDEQVYKPKKLKLSCTKTLCYTSVVTL